MKADPKRFQKYENKPIEFCRDILGVTLWSKQEEILKAAIDHRRVAVRSGHGIGKTFVVACLVLWWFYARQGRVVTTASTWSQVEQVMWSEIANRWKLAKVPLPGELFQTALKIAPMWDCVGLSTNDTTAFQGRHHPRLLAVVDEAPGVPEDIHLAISTLATGALNCVLMIGNPTSLSGTFYNAFARPDIWHCIKASCLDHPNVLAGKEVIQGAVTREWIEDRRSEWGEQHPFWAPRVLGEFPRISTRGIIPLAWVERAQDEGKRQKALLAAEHARMPRVGGLDIARYGENACVLTIRTGDAVEHVEAWHHLNLMETCGRAVKAIKDFKLKLLTIDAAGLGAGVYDRLIEQQMPVYAYNGGHRAFTQSTFSNRRTEMWWHLRERLEREQLWLPQRSPLIDKLVAELVTPEYELMSSGRIKAQTKEDLLKDGKASPDFADSLVLCFAADMDPTALPPIKPGSGQDPLVFTPIDPTQEPFGQLPAGW